MVKSCAAVKCTNRFKKGQNIKFHRFPKDEILRKKWLLAIRRQNFNPTDSSLICSKHFLEEDYFINVHGNKNLKVGSVPSVFDFTGRTEKKSIRRKLLRLEDDNTPSTSSLLVSNSMELDVPMTSVSPESTSVFNGLQPKKRKIQYPIRVGDFKKTDLEDTRKRHEYWKCSQETIQKYKNTIKMLQNKTRRYKNRISSLNSLLDDLKQKKKLSAQSSLILKGKIHLLGTCSGYQR